MFRITRGKLNETICGFSRSNRKPIDRLTLKDKRLADEIVTSIIHSKYLGRAKYKLTLWINGVKTQTEKRMV